MGPDGSPESGNLTAQQLHSLGTESSDEDGDVSFDPSQFAEESDPRISLSSKTSTGGEDWLTANLHVNFKLFGQLAERLDKAQAGALKDAKGDDEVDFGGVRYLVASRGAKQGRGNKSIFMRWGLVSENGLVILLMNRGEAHGTMPNVTVRATSLQLMRFGFDHVWQLMQAAIAEMNGEIVANKLLRVDACVDLAGTDVSEFIEPFNQRWVASRSRSHAKYGIGTFVNEYLQSKRHTGISIGKAPLMCRMYDKLVESQRDILKLAVLEAGRWGHKPLCATRVEFEILRAKLKQFGVNTVDDWVAMRADVLNTLTQDWLRLTAGPVDRKHADRVAMHPVWEKTRAAFFEWCGEPRGYELRPTPTLQINTSRQVAMVLGIFCGMFARVGKDIYDNEKFFREVEFSIREAVGNTDMAAKVARKALELGVVGFAEDF